MRTGRKKKRGKVGLLLASITLVGLLTACGKGEELIWQDMVLGEQLPVYEAAKGEIHSNDEESLWMDIYEIGQDEYKAYAKKCEEFGYTVEVDSSDSSYDAYNQEGYKLSLYYQEYSKELDVSLDAPMQMEKIQWPTSESGKQLPKPKSLQGKITSDTENGFYLYVGNTTKEEYKEYVDLCSKKGFKEDYDKGDTYYSANNKKGYHLSLHWTGDNVMSIDVDAPKEEDREPAKKEESKKNEKGVSKEFKKMMDSYEEFFDEYIEFMEKYNNSDGTDLSLLTDYAKYMSKYAEMLEEFEAIENEDMTAEETEYYLEVQTRINEKLLESLE